MGTGSRASLHTRRALSSPLTSCPRRVGARGPVRDDFTDDLECRGSGRLVRLGRGRACDVGLWVSCSRRGGVVANQVAFQLEGQGRDAVPERSDGLVGVCLGCASGVDCTVRLMNTDITADRVSRWSVVCGTI